MGVLAKRVITEECFEITWWTLTQSTGVLIELCSVWLRSNSDWKDSRHASLYLDLFYSGVEATQWDLFESLRWMEMCSAVCFKVNDTMIRCRLVSVRMMGSPENVFFLLSWYLIPQETCLQEETPKAKQDLSPIRINVVCAIFKRQSNRTIRFFNCIFLSLLFSVLQPNSWLSFILSVLAYCEIVGGKAGLFLAFHVGLSVYDPAHLSSSLQCVVAARGSVIWVSLGTKNCDSESWLVALCHLATRQLSKAWCTAAPA